MTITLEAPIETPDVDTDDVSRGWMLTPEELAATREKIAKLNARAARKGFTGTVEVEVLEDVRKWTYHLLNPEAPSTGSVEVKRPDGVMWPVRAYYGEPVPGIWLETLQHRTVINGEAPCYGGWQFIATLDWDPAAGLIVRTAPGVEHVEREGLREGWCDQCETTRYRNATYLVVNVETGEQRQVGSTCIKDFLGWTATPFLIFEDEIAPEEREGLGGFGGYVDYPTVTVLAVAWAVITRHGYVPASREWDYPTKARVAAVLNPRTPERQREAVELAPAIAEAHVRAHAIREFILSDEFAGDSEFVLNMKAIAAADYVTPRNLGFLAYAPEAHARHVEKSMIRKQLADDAANSQWVGKLGERLVFTGTLVGIKYMGTDAYGWDVKEKTLYTVLTSEGNIVKFWNSHPEGTDGLFGDTEGVTVTFKATVKKEGGHGEYNGRKETTVQRPANVVITPAVAA